MYKFVNKDSLIYVVKQSLPPTEAGILNGMIWGDKSGFEKGFYDYLKNSGLVHLVVVSGSNVMLLVGGGVEFLAKYLGRKKTIIGGLAAGIGYAVMTGGEIPIIRAMLLLSVYYFSQLYGRKYNIWRAMLLGAAIMVTANPKVLQEVSFWLSMTAFLGVVTAKDKKWINFYVTMWITPILALTFGKISLLSPINNLLVSGIVEMSTIVGIVGSVIGMICFPIGKMVLWIAYPALKYLTMVAYFGGQPQRSVVTVNFNWFWLWGWYLCWGYFLLRKNEN